MHYNHVHRGSSPLFIFAFGLLLFWIFGFKVFFFLPLFFIFGGFGMWSCHHHNEEWSDEKRKRKEKPKYDTYRDDDDITYV